MDLGRILDLYSEISLLLLESTTAEGGHVRSPKKGRENWTRNMFVKLYIAKGRTPYPDILSQ